ncbi:P-loop containing nucleoside triphosphate hydrolase protein [Melanogaster broomeanus]|nr:P-loop containing nucleoside triphosphate hydrolase protein [Melanogaster broomeanus]
MKCSPPRQTLPLPPPNSRSNLNVVLFGETGVGKSSVINLLAGHVVTKTSSGVSLCTLQSEEYEIMVDGRTYCVWDTVGLDVAEPSFASGRIGNFIYGVERAHLLIQTLSRQGAGIDLLLFCMKGGRISLQTQRTYNLLYEVLCGKQVPIAAVITHLDMHDPMQAWWSENRRRIDDYGMKFTGHACVTATPGYRGMFADKFAESRRAVMDLLSAHADEGTYGTSEPGFSFTRFLYSLRTPTTPKLLKGQDLCNALIKRVGCSYEDAHRLAEILDRE